MGFAPSVIRLMYRVHAERRFTGPVLTLGVQDVCARYTDLQSWCREDKVPFIDVPVGERLPSTSRYFQARGLVQNGYPHPRTYFRTFGIRDYEDLDFSEAEGPCLIHDLNQPIPEAWKGRYGWVVDGGTIEHIFDIRTVMSNLIALVRPGGSMLHISPLSGWVNHGFYQFTPCFFYDFYQTNGFEDFAGYLVQMPREDVLLAGKIIPYRHSTSIMEIDDKAFRYLFVFVARKKIDKPLCVPTQGIYQDWASIKLGDDGTATIRKSA